MLAGPIYITGSGPQVDYGLPASSGERVANPSAGETQGRLKRSRKPTGLLRSPK